MADPHFWASGSLNVSLPGGALTEFKVTTSADGSQASVFVITENQLIIDRASMAVTESGPDTMIASYKYLASMAAVEPSDSLDAQS